VLREALRVEARAQRGLEPVLREALRVEAGAQRGLEEDPLSLCALIILLVHYYNYIL
jgi:hypothetical protein